MKTHRYIFGVIAVAMFGLFLASCSNPTQAEPTLRGADLNALLTAQLAPFGIPLPEGGVFTDGAEYTRARIMEQMEEFLEEMQVPPDSRPMILGMINAELDELFAGN